MTKTALENRRMEVEREKVSKDIKQREKELSDKETQRKWQSKENKKDRIQKYVTSAAQLIGDVTSAKNLMGYKKLGSLRNDPEWYKRYIGNSPVFTNLPLFRRLGQVLPNGVYNSWDRASLVAVPGIATFEYISTIGPQPHKIASEYSMNPANQILMRTKEQVLKLNSRSSVNWEAADLGLNIFATAEIVTALLEYKRLISVVHTYAVNNAYLCKQLLFSLGVNTPDNFMSNIAEHEKNYEILRLRFNTACVAPNSLSIYHRKEFLASNVFIDEPHETAQMYVYVHAQNDYKYLNNTGDKLISMTAPGMYWSTPTLVLQAIGQMITSIVENPDFQEMYADLRHAVSDTELYQLPALEKGTPQLLLYQPEMLGQIKNSNWPGGRYINTSISLAANCTDIHSGPTGYLYQGATWNDTYCVNIPVVNNLPVWNPVLNLRFNGNFPLDKMIFHRIPEFNANDEDEILSSTRLHSIWTYNDTDSKLILDYSGTEAIITCSINRMNSSSNYNTTYIPYDRYVHTPTTIAQGAGYEHIASLTSAFRYFPLLNQVCAYDLSTPSSLAIYTIGDVGVYSIINYDDLANLHSFCVLSELFLNVSKWNSR